MARRRPTLPPVARPSGRQRWVEWGKDILIVALLCSAVALAWQTPIASQVRGWMAEPAQTATPALRAQSEAITPYAVAVRNELGLYGVNYDADQVGRAFEQLSPLLGEGLASADAPENTSQRQWQALLEAPGVTCMFQGAPPLSALSAWLGGDDHLAGEAQALVLAWDGGQVWLAWRSGDSYQRAKTQVAYEGHMDAALAEFSPNGTAYAYALARDDRTYSTLDPYVLVSMTAPRPVVYAAVSPDLVGDRTALEQLLSALGFQAGVDFAYETAGELAINENGDRLRVSAAGKVAFRAGDEARYGVACKGEVPTAAEAAAAAWDLLNRAAGTWKGEGSWVLAGAEVTADGWIITFRSRLNGIPVWTGANGAAARFAIKGRSINSFVLSLRTYTATETLSAVPGERLAAAALDALPGSGGRLVLRYNDNGGAELSAGWMAEE